MQTSYIEPNEKLQTHISAMLANFNDWMIRLLMLEITIDTQCETLVNLLFLSLNANRTNNLQLCVIEHWVRAFLLQRT